MSGHVKNNIGMISRAIVWLGILTSGLFSADEADRVVLLKVGPTMGQWTMDRETLLKTSTWDQKQAPALPVEKAAAIARKTLGDLPIDYIELRRPLKPLGDVFVYVVAGRWGDSFDKVEKGYVVILLNGKVLPADPRR